MKKAYLFLSALALAGCATTANQIKEPERSEYYFFCVGNGVLVTTCQCMEEKAVKDTGITSLAGLDETDPKVAKFIGALQGSMEQCDAETKKALDEAK